MYTEKRKSWNVVLRLPWFSCGAVCVFSRECAGPAKPQSMRGLSKAALFELWIKQTSLVTF